MASVSFTLNGQPITVSPRDGESLLETLRERCGIRSAKDGCSPQGQCGACLAIVGGHAVTTCAMPAEKAAGKEVLTLEGVSPAERAQLADAFVAEGAVQCGFCTPGMVLRTKHLLDRNASPTREEVAKAIDVHLKKLKALKREIKGRKRLVGRLTGWEIVKGKLGSHDGPEGEFEHYFATGVHFLKEAIDAGKARGVLISRGSKYYGPWGEKGKSRADMEAYYDEGPEQQQRLDELRDACFQQAGLRVRFR